MLYTLEGPSIVQSVKNLESKTIHVHGFFQQDKSGVKFIGAGSVWYKRADDYLNCNRRSCIDNTRKCDTRLLFVDTPELEKILKYCKGNPNGRAYYNGKAQFTFSELKDGEKRFHACLLWIRIMKLATILDERRTLNLMNPNVQDQHKQDTSAAIFIEPLRKMKSTCDRVFVGGHMFQKDSSKCGTWTDQFCEMRLQLGASMNGRFRHYQLIDPAGNLNRMWILMLHDQ